jgi:hypothetical protein
MSNTCERNSGKISGYEFTAKISELIDVFGSPPDYQAVIPPVLIPKGGY